ncbi:eCIS core domain-containing protein [Thermomonospora amylolytica]|uniref:eCIS core domain-containing protein n=1 Tax=Thermomonospora amylolytica TaxID=1411117 RepID=UPI000E6C2F94|nr:DUF4157 domain-containing protein [Thermomonospora amylolytica]
MRAGHEITRERRRDPLRRSAAVSRTLAAGHDPLLRLQRQTGNLAIQTTTPNADDRMAVMPGQPPPRALSGLPAPLVTGGALQCCSPSGGECSRCRAERLGHDARASGEPAADLSSDARTGTPDGSLEQVADRLADRISQLSRPEPEAGNAALRLFGAQASRPLQAPLRQRAETVFGTDLGNVRIHSDAAARNASSRLAARAFTVGEDIYLGPAGPGTDVRGGLRLLGHELTHVVQQRRGLSRSALRGDGDAYEREADAGGRAFEHGRRFRVSTVTGDLGGVQRLGDPATPRGEAERVGTEDSPYGLPFLGEADTVPDLLALMAELAAEEGGARLALIPEHEAFPAPSGGAVAMKASVTDPLLSQAQLMGRPLQRATVAGCHVPGLTPGMIGIMAHYQIEGTCTVTSPSCEGEVAIPGDGRADLFRRRIPAMDEIGEIKPASWLGRGLRPLAAAQLAGYLVAWSAHTGLPAVPMWSFTFPGEPFVGDPAQQLRVYSDSGLYFYYCTKGRRRRVRRPVRLPSPAPVPAPAPRTAPSEEGVTGRDVAKGAAAAGVGIGVGYLIYRGVRMVPSLFPPLWPTFVPNLVTP